MNEHAKQRREVEFMEETEQVVVKGETEKTYALVLLMSEEKCVGKEG